MPLYNLLLYHNHSIMIDGMKHRVVKVRLYPNSQQRTALAKAFGCTRWLWNNSLNETNRLFKETGKGLSAATMKARIVELKKEYRKARLRYIPKYCNRQSLIYLKPSLTSSRSELNTQDLSLNTASSLFSIPSTSNSSINVFLFPRLEKLKLIFIGCIKEN